MSALHAATCSAATCRLSRPQRRASALEALVPAASLNCLLKPSGLLRARTPSTVRQAAPSCGGGGGGGVSARRTGDDVSSAEVRRQLAEPWSRAPSSAPPPRARKATVVPCAGAGLGAADDRPSGRRGIAGTRVSSTLRALPPTKRVQPARPRATRVARHTQHALRAWVRPHAPAAGPRRAAARWRRRPWQAPSPQPPAPHSCQRSGCAPAAGWEPLLVVVKDGENGRWRGARLLTQHADRPRHHTTDTGNLLESSPSSALCDDAPAMCSPAAHCCVRCRARVCTQPTPRQRRCPSLKCRYLRQQPPAR